MGRIPGALDYSNYSGRWIALIRGRVVGQGGTPGQALLAAKTSRHKEIPQVIFVPTKKPFEFSPIVERVRTIIPDGINIFLVGGAVRDVLRSHPIHDYDFVVQGDALRYARKVADHIEGSYFPLDEERSTARVIYSDKKGMRTVLDFSAFRGASLEIDLEDRDFTINAMALDLRSPQSLLDPLGGSSDLIKKTITACSRSSFINDPLRILRAIRMAAGFEMRIHPETRMLMREAVHLLENVSPERLRDELFRMLRGPKPHITIRALDLIGALSYILPELEALKGVEQSPPHVKDVWEHTLDTLKNLELLLDTIISRQDPDNALGLMLGLGVIRLGACRQKIAHHLDMELVQDRNLRSLLFFAGLYHDIAKPQKSQVEPDGRIRFFGHDQSGCAISAYRAAKLKLSKKESDRLEVIIRHHMRPTQLAREDQKPSSRVIYRYFRDTGEVGVDIGLLSLADLLATYGNTLPQDRWTRQLDVVRALFDAWWERADQQVNPPTILNGHDLMEAFGLDPGPIIGELLEKVREAQVAGEVGTREDAICIVKAAIDQ